MRIDAEMINSTDPHPRIPLRHSRTILSHTNVASSRSLTIEDLPPLDRERWGGVNACGSLSMMFRMDGI
jgi:hypothetical protein